MNSENDVDLKHKIDIPTKQFEDLKNEMNEKYKKLFDYYENLQKEMSTIKAHLKIDKNEKENEKEKRNISTENDLKHIDLNQNNFKLEEKTKISVKENDNEKEKNLPKEVFYYIKDIQKIEQEIKSLLKPYIKIKKKEVNISQAFERQSVQKENFKITLKIKNNLKLYKGPDYLTIFKKLNYFKTIAFIVRYSHEMAFILLKIFFNAYKENNGIISFSEEITRLLFSA